MGLPIQAGIRRMLNRFRLHRRVHDDLLETLLRDRTRGLSHRDRGLQQLLHTLLADALAPTRHL